MDSQKQSIYMKFELNEEDCKAIRSLESVCYEQQKINLKLELDFKMRQSENCIKNKIMTEFFYYENNILVGYLGLGNFGGTTVEISGMVHPKFRRKRIFKKLFLLAKEEWERIYPAEVLVLCDHTSISGLAFINSLGAEYASSEYKMCLNKKALEVRHTNAINLRLATNEDTAEINGQTSIYFGHTENEDKEDVEQLPIQVDNNFISYMAEHNGRIIGKIHTSITDNEGFIYGFGVLPDFRGKGYGREILNSAINILKNKEVDNILLDVATENKNALGLYESCGFEEISVMDYYLVS